MVHTAIAESQNHRMVEVGRDLWGSCSPTSLPKQGHLHQAAQDCVQVGFEYLQRRRLCSLPGQPVPVLHHPQSKEVPRVQLELPRLQFVPVAPCPVAGHHWKESGPVLLTPTLKIFRGISKVPSQPSLLQATQAWLPRPLLVGEMLQSPHHLRSLLAEACGKTPDQPVLLQWRALVGPQVWFPRMVLLELHFPVIDAQERREEKKG